MCLTIESEKTKKGLSLKKRCWFNSNWNIIWLLDHNWSYRTWIYVWFILMESDVIQPSNDPLEVLVGPVTRLRAKKFKKAFNGLLQDTWAKVNFKRICNNKEQALINLIHVQEGLVGGTKIITQGLGEEDSIRTV
jgi:hypothetical protein